MESLQILLESGADAKLADRWGNDAIDYYLFEFMRRQRSAPQNVVDILRKAGAKGSPATVKLFAAIRQGDRKGVKAAIESGADVNRTMPSNEGTPLKWAYSEEMVDILLK